MKVHRLEDSTAEATVVMDRKDDIGANQVAELTKNDTSREWTHISATYKDAEK
jgi:hypothetical protein